MGFLGSVTIGRHLIQIQTEVIESEPPVCRSIAILNGRILRSVEHDFSEEMSKDQEVVHSYHKSFIEVVRGKLTNYITKKTNGTSTSLDSIVKATANPPPPQTNVTPLPEERLQQDSTKRVALPAPLISASKSNDRISSTTQTNPLHEREPSSFKIVALDEMEGPLDPFSHSSTKEPEKLLSPVDTLLANRGKVEAFSHSSIKEPEKLPSPVDTLLANRGKVEKPTYELHEREPSSFKIVSLDETEGSLDSLPSNSVKPREKLPSPVDTLLANRGKVPLPVLEHEREPSSFKIVTLDEMDSFASGEMVLLPPPLKEKVNEDSIPFASWSQPPSQEISYDSVGVLDPKEFDSVKGDQLEETLRLQRKAASPLDKKEDDKHFVLVETDSETLRREESPSSEIQSNQSLETKQASCMALSALDKLSHCRVAFILDRQGTTLEERVWESRFRLAQMNARIQAFLDVCYNEKTIEAFGPPEMMLFEFAEGYLVLDSLGGQNHYFIAVLFSNEIKVSMSKYKLKLILPRIEEAFEQSLYSEEMIAL